MWNKLKNTFNSTDSLVSLALGLAVILVVGVTIVNYIRGRNREAVSTTAKQTASETTSESSLPTQHTVLEGETLWSIAQNYYKSGYNWVDIKTANNLTNPNKIEAGQTLTIPAATPIAVPTASVTSGETITAPKEKSYTVVRGDDLWNIAVKEYGSGYRWVDVARANKLANPNIIHAGNILVLP